MLDSAQFGTLILRPVLRDLQLYSEEAVELLLFTCANESNGGTYLRQVSGPALGIFQMEPETYNDIWQNYILKKQQLTLLMMEHFNVGRMPSEDRLIYDLRFATVMARIHYARVPEALPALHDLDGLWNYYKKYYNTSEGKASREQTINKYQVFRNN